MEKTSALTPEQEQILAQPIMVNPHLRIVYCSDSEILVKHGSRSRISQIIKDDGRTKLLGKILRNVKEPSSLQKIVEQGLVKAEQLEDACNLVSYLLKEKVLIAPEAYLPHVYLSMHFGDQVAGIASRTVGVVGAGFLGSRIARELGRLNVKGIVLLDDRTVQKSDVVYFEIHSHELEIGKPYALAVKDDLKAHRYENVRVLENALDDRRALTELFEQVDFVVVCLEAYSPKVLHAINEVATAVGKPWMSLYVDGSEAIIGPIYVPGETPCYNEFEIQHEAVIGLKEDYLIYKESLLESELHTSSLVLPPYASMVSGWTLTALLPFLISGRSFGVGRCVRVDLERVSVDYEEVLKLPRCPACAENRPGYRHTYL